MGIRSAVGQLGAGVAVAGLFAIFLLGSMILVPVFSTVGVSPQTTMIVVAGAVFVGFWAIGLKFLLGS